MVTEAETAKIIALLREYYPRDVESTTIKAKVRAWWLVLRDYPYDAMQAAAVSFAANDRKGFMPSPGQLVEQLQLLTSRDALSAQEAWALVHKAVSRADLNNPSKEFDKLPPEVQKTIGSANMLREWGLVDERTFNTVIYSNFVRAYETHEKRRQAFEAVPAAVRQVIQGVADRLALGSGGMDENRH